MIIQINTDHHLNVSSDYAQKIEEMILNEVDRFDEHLTRIEVYLSDQNAHKELGADKRCHIEARLKGKQPLAVSADAETYDLAISSAAAKLKATLSSIVDKQRGY